VTTGGRQVSGSGSARSLTERSLAAAKWNYAGVAVKVLAQFVTSVVLARLLGPGPFGVYAAVLLVTGVGVQIVERGFGPALIQAPALTDEMIRYAFTRLLLGGLAVAVVMCAAAPWVAALFRYAALSTAIYGSALYMFVYPLSVVPGALLRRDLDMKSYQVAQIAAYLIGYVVVGIPGALVGLGAWSLIGALVTQLIVNVFICYGQVRHAIRPLFRLNDQQFTSFGNVVFAANLLNWPIENLDNLVVGRLYGMHALGLYAVCYNLVRSPTDYVMTSVQGVLFAAGAKAQENLAGLRKACLTVISAEAFLLYPVFLGIALVAPTVVQGIYGGKWLGAETLLLPLALAMPGHALMVGSGLLWARGQGGAECKVEAGTLAIFVIALFVASRISLQAIAWAVLIVYTFRAIWLISVILSSVQLSWGAFLAAARGGLLLGVITAGTFYLVDMGLAAAGINALNRLCILAGVGLIIVTTLPICIRGLIASPELRTLLEGAAPQSPGLLRTVVLMYTRA
jgi:O-antigen/teichoic acid export membrane protein